MLAADLGRVLGPDRVPITEHVMRTFPQCVLRTIPIGKIRQYYRPQPIMLESMTSENP